MELGKQQEEALKGIVSWFRKKDKQVYMLSGYAGTGKTTLVSHLIKEELKLGENEVAFITPTGKAASVLITKGVLATTLHKLIYNPVEEEYETKIGDSTIKSKRIKFVLKQSIPNLKLIVLDEVSMVEDKVMADLLSFGIPVLCCGDPGQLDPIQGINSFMINPDYILTDIVRQNEDNPIIFLSKLARYKEPIPFGYYGNNVAVVHKDEIRENTLRKMYLSFDQIICGKNSTRYTINNSVRKYKGIDVSSSKIPLAGEKVICDVNNWGLFLDIPTNRYNLVNGIISEVKECSIIDEKLKFGKISIKPDFLEDVTDDILFDCGIFTDGTFTYDIHQNAFVAGSQYYPKIRFKPKGMNESSEEYRKRIIDFIMKSKNSTDEEQINRFEFAYAISCHKSQGSEFNDVVLVDESKVFKEPEKWLYTGITRAKNKLIILR